MALAVKRAKPYRAQRFGIQNHVGGIWSPETFETEGEAAAYLDRQRIEWKRRHNIDLSGHSVVPVNVTISIRKARK